MGISPSATDVARALQAGHSTCRRLVFCPSGQQGDDRWGLRGRFWWERGHGPVGRSVGGRARERRRVRRREKSLGGRLSLSLSSLPSIAASYLRTKNNPIDFSPSPSIQTKRPGEAETARQCPAATIQECVFVCACVLFRPSLSR